MTHGSATLRVGEGNTMSGRKTIVFGIRGKAVPLPHHKQKTSCIFELSLVYEFNSVCMTLSTAYCLLDAALPRGSKVNIKRTPSWSCKPLRIFSWPASSRLKVWHFGRFAFQFALILLDLFILFYEGIRADPRAILDLLCSHLYDDRFKIEYM